MRGKVFSTPAILRPEPIVTATGTGVVPMLPASWACRLSDNELRWDAGVFELFGLSPGALLDRRAIVEMYTEESRETLERLRSAALRMRGSFTFEAQIRRADGALRWMRVVADTAVINGKITHLYGTKRDITDEMQG
ncbi:PAS domain-containing protein [Sphingomonas floccifaciens]|uniref:PAS domain-containing protein n=1 Tax=Sphingomonas floccifaciens TaxID=1844115 RepID=A0ABW4N9V9_9SPHN